MTATTTSLRPESCPTTPPNTEASRSRANSEMSRTSTHSRAPSEVAAGPSILVNGVGPRRQGPPRNNGHVNFAAIVTHVQETTPGRFYEASTDVPDNTPYGTEAGAEAPDSLRHGPINAPFDADALDEALKNTPSKKSSPTQSVISGSVSSYSEPLYMVIPPRNSGFNGASPLSITNNVDDTSIRRDNVSPVPAAFRGSFSSDGSATTIGGGIREYSDWAAEVESEVLRNLTRLKNLAVDDFQREPEKAVEQHYRTRLLRLLDEDALPSFFEYLIEEEPEEEATTPGPKETPMATNPNEGRPNGQSKLIPVLVKTSNVPSTGQLNDFHLRLRGLEEQVHSLQDHKYRNAMEAIAKNKRVDDKRKEFNAKHQDHEKKLERLLDDVALMKRMLVSQGGQAQGSESTTKLGDDSTQGSSKKA